MENKYMIEVLISLFTLYQGPYFVVNSVRMSPSFYPDNNGLTFILTFGNVKF